MNNRKLTKLAVGIVVIGGACAYLLYGVLRSSLAYYYAVDDFVESPLARASETSAPAASRLIRLAGRVQEGSISTGDGDELRLDFVLAGQRHTVPVRFLGVAPDNFAGGREVLVEGRVSPGGAFAAEKVMTRCESKYRAKLPPDLGRK